MMMNKQRTQTAKPKCSQCGADAIVNIRKDEFSKGVLIQNLPATFCQNCGEELYDRATVQLVEKIASEPDVLAQLMELPVARVA